jgi:membrane-anchored glycerophosphoryl diester phosphodiesterase (GDPDase)
VGLLALYVIANLILVIGNLIAVILLWPALVQAGYLVARQGQSSFGEAFGDLSLLLKVFVYLFILLLIPGILIGLGYVLGLGATVAGVAAAYAETYTEGGNEAMSGVMALGGTGGILVVAGLIILFILNLFGWAGPYAILSGRAGVFRAIGQSFSLTARNFGKLFLALLWYMVLAILGSLLCGLGLPVVVLTGYVFWPLLYLALTGEEGVSHS